MSVCPFLTRPGSYYNTYTHKNIVTNTVCLNYNNIILLIIIMITTNKMYFHITINKFSMQKSKKKVEFYNS